MATEALRRAQADLDEASAEAAALASQRSEIAAMCSRQETRATELEAVLPGLEAANAEAEQRAEALRAALDKLAERATAVSALRRDFEVRAAGIEERRAIQGQRLGDVEARLAGNATDREKAALRRTRLDVAAVATERLAKFVGSRWRPSSGPSRVSARHDGTRRRPCAAPQSSSTSSGASGLASSTSFRRCGRAAPGPISRRPSSGRDSRS